MNAPNPEKDGNEKGTENIKVGVDPSRPIGLGNPPAAGMIQPGEVRNPTGWPKGRKQARTVVRAILDATRKVNDPNLKKVVAQFLGVEVEDVTNRELMLIMQANKAIVKSDTQAATLMLKAAGELQDDVNLIPPSTMRLDSVSEAEVAKAREKMLEEDL